LVENRKFGFCVEYDIDEELANPIFDFTVIDSGYGWIFPKNDHITIGLGTI
jgi:flavin-dependent dehydrogenase